ncbi:MAG: hypothetical protein IT204_06365 [Fimbriimonadaceae bacterium]|nr:hypothetical protein [Fimbriimonadaceae bacterium]
MPEYIPIIDPGGPGATPITPGGPGILSRPTFECFVQVHSDVVASAAKPLVVPILPLLVTPGRLELAAGGALVCGEDARAAVLASRVEVTVPTGHLASGVPVAVRGEGNAGEVLVLLAQPGAVSWPLPTATALVDPNQATAGSVQLTVRPLDPVVALESGTWELDWLVRLSRRPTAAAAKVHLQTWLLGWTGNSQPGLLKDAQGAVWTDLKTANAQGEKRVAVKLRVVPTKLQQPCPEYLVAVTLATFQRGGQEFRKAAAAALLVPQLPND